MDIQLVDKHFGLKVRTTTVSRSHEVYLAIPWDIGLNTSISSTEHSQPGKCCQSVATSISGDITSGYRKGEVYDNAQAIFLDQDRRVTHQKTVAINKIIRDLDLSVATSGAAYSRFTDCDVYNTSVDFHFKVQEGSRSGKLWIPRVIALQEVELELEEVRQDDY